MSEQEPDTENVLYLDEYPELKKRVWLRNLEEQRRVGKDLVHMTHIIPMPERLDPDEPA